MCAAPLILSADWVFPVGGPPVANASVVIEAGGIQAILPGQPPSTAGQTHCQILTPGLINAHTHLSFSGYPQVPAQDTMGAWLAEVVTQTRQPQQSLSPEQRCRLGIQQAVKSGTTGFGDISAEGASVAAMQAAGVRGVAFLEWFHPRHVVDEERLNAIAGQIEALQTACAGSSLVSVGVSPHSPYNVSPLAWQYLRARLGALALPWQTHLAESPDELAWLAGQPATGIGALHQHLLSDSPGPLRRADNPVAYLRESGLLTAGLSVAHGIELTDEALLQLQDAGVGLVHCPRSNLFLHGKTLALPQDKPRPLVALGTDSHLSVPNLDLREEARVACQLHGWSASVVLEVLTLNAARILGWENVGSLQPGWQADCVGWRVPCPASLPLEEILSCWLAQGTVESVYSAGQRLTIGTSAEQ